METFTALKLGLKLKPLQLVLLYRAQSERLRKRWMPIRRLTLTTDPRAKAEELRSRHGPHLQNVPVYVISRLVAIAQETLMRIPLSEAVSRVDEKFSADSSADLNLLSDSQLKVQKDFMQISFQANGIDRNHRDFVYDRKIDFEAPTAHSAWDLDDDE